MKKFNKMRHLKTYEGLFNNFFKKNDIPRDRKSFDKELDLIIREVSDSLLDLFDTYDVTYFDHSINKSSPTPNQFHWCYKYQSLLNDPFAGSSLLSSELASGIFVKVTKNGILHKSIINQINLIIPTINARTGVKINSPEFLNENWIIIDVNASEVKKRMNLSESKVHDLESVKDQFYQLLNGQLKSHWLKFDKVTYALYQAFCKEYGYNFDDEDDIFSNKHKGLFTLSTLNKWFQEWREYELTDKEKNKKYHNMDFPYLESFLSNWIKKKVEISKEDWKKECEAISDEISDSLMDIFDEYGITYSQSGVDFYSPDLRWCYFSRHGDIDGLNLGVRITGITELIRNNNINKWRELLDDIEKILPIISKRTGVKVERRPVRGDEVIISFETTSDVEKRIRKRNI